MSNASKMDVSTVYEMFEEINKKIDKQPSNTVEPAQVDMTAINILTEQLENVIEEIRKPVIIKQQYRHTIDIGSSKVFLSLIIMTLIIIGLSYVVGEQRRSISQYKENDLKYRYVKMQGQTNEESLYRLERQFQYGDNIKIIRKQVEEYEELVREQAERMERARANSEDLEKLQKDLNMLKNRKTD